MSKFTITFLAAFYSCSIQAFTVGWDFYSEHFNRFLCADGCESFEEFRKFYSNRNCKDDFRTDIEDVILKSFNICKLTDFREKYVDKDAQVLHQIYKLKYGFKVEDTDADSELEVISVIKRYLTNQIKNEEVCNSKLDYEFVRYLKNKICDVDDYDLIGDGLSLYWDAKYEGKTKYTIEEIRQVYLGFVNGSYISLRELAFFYMAENNEATTKSKARKIFQHLCALNDGLSCRFAANEEFSEHGNYGSEATKMFAEKAIGLGDEYSYLILGWYWESKYDSTCNKQFLEKAKRYIQDLAPDSIVEKSKFLEIINDKLSKESKCKYERGQPTDSTK